MKEEKFEAITASTLLGGVIGFGGGMVLYGRHYNETHGYTAYQDAEGNISTISSQIGSLQYTEHVLANEHSNSNSSAIGNIKTEIIQRQAAIKSQTALANKTGYNPNSLGPVIFEGPVAGLFILGALVTAVRYRIHKRRISRSLDHEIDIAI